MRLFKSTLYAVRMEAPLDAGQAYRAWETTVATIVVGQWRAFTRVLVPRRLQLAHSFLAVEVRPPSPQPAPYHRVRPSHLTNVPVSTLAARRLKPRISRVDLRRVDPRRRDGGDGCWLGRW